MSSILGTWSLVSEEAFDIDGNALPPLFGAMPLGTMAFTHEGCVAAILTDGQPGSLAVPRRMNAFCGSYTFGGSRLVMHIDAATQREMMSEPQVLEAKFQFGTLTLAATATDGSTRIFTWWRLE